MSRARVVAGSSASPRPMSWTTVPPSRYGSGAGSAAGRSWPTGTPTATSRCSSSPPGPAGQACGCWCCMTTPTASSTTSWVLSRPSSRPTAAAGRWSASRATGRRCSNQLAVSDRPNVWRNATMGAAEPLALSTRASQSGDEDAGWATLGLALPPQAAGHRAPRSGASRSRSGLDGRLGRAADLDGEDQGKDEVQQREGDRRAEVVGAAVELGPDDDQAERAEPQTRHQPGGGAGVGLPAADKAAQDQAHRDDHHAGDQHPGAEHATIVSQFTVIPAASAITRARLATLTRPAIQS